MFQHTHFPKPISWEIMRPHRRGCSGRAQRSRTCRARRRSETRKREERLRFHGSRTHVMACSSFPLLNNPSPQTRKGRSTFARTQSSISTNQSRHYQLSSAAPINIHGQGVSASCFSECCPLSASSVYVPSMPKCPSLSTACEWICSLFL